MDWLILANELSAPLRAGKLDVCIQRVETALRGMPTTPYHIVLILDFTNDLHEVARYFDEFAQMERARPLRAIYTETNGFFINPDRWYFEVFSYSVYGGHEDYDWLAAWEDTASTSFTLTGMEPLQTVYQVFMGHVSNPGTGTESMEREQDIRVKGISDLLVVLRFQDLIQRSTVFMQQVKVPLLATSHEYDFIYEVQPART
jgi:hypothetical protein